MPKRMYAVEYTTASEPGFGHHFGHYDIAYCFGYEKSDSFTSLCFWLGAEGDV